MPSPDALGVLGGHRRGVVGGVGHGGTLGEPGGTGISFSSRADRLHRCGSSPTRLAVTTAVHYPRQPASRWRASRGSRRWVGPGRPAEIALGGFPRPARRTRRAHY
jgi:hypothetical protein